VKTEKGKSRVAVSDPHTARAPASRVPLAQLLRLRRRLLQAAVVWLLLLRFCCQLRLLLQLLLPQRRCLLPLRLRLRLSQALLQLRSVPALRASRGAGCNFGARGQFTHHAHAESVWKLAWTPLLELEIGVGLRLFGTPVAPTVRTPQCPWPTVRSSQSPWPSVRRPLAPAGVCVGVR